MPKVGMEPIRKKQLIDATLSCIGKYGFKDTTVQKISKEAKVSTGVLHHYFDNKNALLEEALRHTLRCLKDTYLTQIKNAQTPKERLYAIVEVTLSGEQTSSEGFGIWLSFWSECLHSEKLARLEQISRERHNSNLRYTLKQVMPEKEAARHAVLINSLMDGLWLRCALSPKKMTAKEAVKIVTDYIDSIM